MKIKNLRYRAFARYYGCMYIYKYIIIVSLQWIHAWNISQIAYHKTIIRREIVTYVENSNPK